MSDFVHHHKEIIVWLGAFSAVTFVGSLILIPFLCVRMGEDYFMPQRDHEETLAGRHPVIRWTGLILKNLVGLLLFAAGFAMLFLPGQGLLTMIIGVMMLNFPGKRRLELRMIRLPGVLRVINAMRARADQPLLQLPQEVTSSASPASWARTSNPSHIPDPPPRENRSPRPDG